MLELHKKRLSHKKKKKKKKKKMTHTFFIAVKKAENIALNYSTDL